jgi:hypothetical protein
MKRIIKYVAIGIGVAIVVLVLTYCTKDQEVPVKSQHQQMIDVNSSILAKKSVSLDLQRENFKNLIKEKMKEVEKEARKKAKIKKDRFKDGGILDSITWEEIENEVYELTDAEAYHFMFDLLQPSIDVTDSLYDIDLTEDFASNDFGIVLSGVTAEQTYWIAENDIMQDTTTTSIVEMTTYPPGTPDDLMQVADCLATALIGIPLANATIGGSLYLSAAEAVTKKAIKKFCLSFLGPAATLVAVWDFGKCMGWWGVPIPE